MAADVIAAEETPTRILADAFRLLSDPTRLRILDALVDGVQCNCNLGRELGLPMNLVSHHLRVLRQAGLIQAQRDPDDARWIYYSVDAEALAALRSSMAAFLDPGRIHDRAPTCGPGDPAT